MNYFKSIDKQKKNNKFLSHGGLRLKKKKFKEPTFSIITVVLNGEKYIENTIKSVLRQKKSSYEYIIIDGGSSDNTLNIIKKYSQKITYWVSQKDNGIYDAFNKGMILSQGKYIGIVNSDDVYNKNAFKIMSKYIKKNPNLDFFFGSVKKHWGILHGYRPEKINYSWGFYSSHSTGFFIKRTSAKKVGLYNLKYKYHADYDYFYRMIVKMQMKGMATKKNEVIGIFRRGGFSSTIPYKRLFFEEIKIRYNNKQSLLLISIIIIYKIIKHFKKFF
jgi:glycosyltransferase involved in cell wall biosynthesis